MKLWAGDNVGFCCLNPTYKIAIASEQIREDAIASNTGEIHDRNGRLIAKLMPKGKHLRFS